MTEQPEKVSVQIQYKGIEQTFSGPVEQTWLLMNNFFSDIVPKFEIASRLWLSPNLERLAKDLKGIVAYSPEGSNLMLQKSKLTDNEALLLWLLASYLGNRLRLIPADSLSKEDLQGKLGKTGKITSTRLGELVKAGFISKTPDEKFVVTTFGIVQAQKEILPKIRARAEE